MRVLGITGFSGAGKTTLLEKLIPLLVSRGMRVSTLKHAHHGFDVDVPGKDSYRHRAAGASEVLIASARRYAILHELRDQPEPGLEALLARMSPVDLVLVEGYKREGHAKIEIWRQANGQPLLQPDDPAIIAVACDTDPPHRTAPRLDIDDAAGIADFIQTWMRSAPLWPGSHLHGQGSRHGAA
ncbi:molybdopterin-guanine dinucleotide biosynthesis protein B [Ferrovibrio sp.]|uniref:molybdopterin-guanine dinucleotide biosynthesis protein B n=1 Tax=Ferrovibrio sp. TaxID=1917215 RepID=UPI0025BDD4F6|nr:molybdopterin-guanine dinucleotide biosynthesis protein B [Ferrovibrio sp.]MBX3453035.1 molybdopterin-guanine dinucleotide biosynthesis protein B [Ferrovibrio sp.]